MLLTIGCTKGVGNYRKLYEGRRKTITRFKSFGTVFVLFFLFLLGQGTAGSAEREKLKIGMIGPFSGWRSLYPLLQNRILYFFD
jgi:hypothetical protein